MAKINRFEDLKMWQESILVTKKIYLLFEEGKLKKEFSLRDQIFRACLSISSNIAEGFEYNNDKEFVRYLKYAKGSCGEARSQLYLIKELNLIEITQFEVLQKDLLGISGMIKNFINYLVKNQQVKKDLSTL